MTHSLAESAVARISASRPASFTLGSSRCNRPALPAAVSAYRARAMAACRPSMVCSTKLPRDTLMRVKAAHRRSTMPTAEASQQHQPHAEHRREQIPECGTADVGRSVARKGSRPHRGQALQSLRRGRREAPDEGRRGDLLAGGRIGIVGRHPFAPGGSGGQDSQRGQNQERAQGHPERAKGSGAGRRRRGPREVRRWLAGGPDRTAAGTRRRPRRRTFPPARRW